MALAGSIKEFGLAEIFQIISLQQKTGELIVQGSEGSVTVIFEKGMIVGADASFRQVESRLGQILVRSGKISKFQLKRALDKQQKTLQPLGTALAELQEIDQETLRQVLSQQIHETVYLLLRWTDGEYRFVPRRSVEYDKNLIKPINTEFLIMEGFRITDEWPEIEKKIPSFQLLIQRVPGVQWQGFPEVRIADSEEDQEKISANEKKIYDLLDSEKTVQELIDTSQLGEFDTCQTIYGLMSKGLVEKVPEGESKKKPVEIHVNYTNLVSRLYLPVGILLLCLIGWVGLQFGPKNLVFLYPVRFTGLQVLKEATAKSWLNKMQNILVAYQAEHKRYPESLEELVDKGIILEQDLYDPWNQKYALVKGEKGILLSSSGPDGKWQTEDDIIGTPLVEAFFF